MALHDPGTIEEGDPSAIRAQADELRTVASNIHTVARMLRTVSTKGVWESCAGTMFDNEVGKTPDDLEAIAGRLSGTERIIRPYADRLEDDQATLERIRTRYDDNDRTAEDRRTRLVTMTPEDPEYVTVDREYRAARILIAFGGALALVGRVVGDVRRRAVRQRIEGRQVAAPREPAEALA